MQMFDFPKQPLESSICLIYGMSSSIALRTASEQRLSRLGLKLKLDTSLVITLKLI